jgi:nucleoid DNA-binding protein
MSKFTRYRIVEILRSGAGLETPKAREVSGRIIEILAAAITAGETVELRGLGTFEVRKRKAYKAHNPRTLAPVDVPAHRIVFFRPCSKLKAALNTSPPV